MDVFRISPQFTSNDWVALDENNKDDWGNAAEIVQDRLDGRFLRFATKCLMDKHSGFVVLAIDSLLAETIQQFKEGITDGRWKSKQMITRFLEGSHFQPHFDADIRKSFYTDIRCGLLHQAEAKGMWLIRRNQSTIIQKIEEDQKFIYIIDVKLFHSAVSGSLDDYLELVSDPNESSLRHNLWTKMNDICNVRKKRGAFYGLED